MKCILTYFQDSWGGGLSQHLWVGPLWPSALHNIKSGLRRVRNCVGELALRFETVRSVILRVSAQPNHSYAVFMFSLHSDPTRAIVVAGVLHRVWSELPHRYLQDYS